MKLSNTNGNYKEQCYTGIDLPRVRNGISLHVAYITVHSTSFNKIQTLRPGYIPPSRKDIANKYLDLVYELDKYLHLVYEKEYKKCADDLNNEAVCLSLDGWSNIHNEPIICATNNIHRSDLFS